MEWIDEEEQRRKHAAPIATSSSAAALSPQAVGPLVLDDFMSQWLHPNWSRVSCVAKMHLSPEQVRRPVCCPPSNNVIDYFLSVRVEERAPFKCRCPTASLSLKAISFSCSSSMEDPSHLVR